MRRICAWVSDLAARISRQYWALTADYSCDTLPLWLARRFLYALVHSARLSLTPQDPVTPLFATHPNFASVSPLVATHPKNAPVSPLLATHFSNSNCVLHFVTARTFFARRRYFLA